MNTQSEMIPAAVTYRCSHCGQEKPVSAFSTRRDRPGWINPRCRPCMVLAWHTAPRRQVTVTAEGAGRRCTICKEVKPASEFHRNKAVPGGLDHRCKDCKRRQGQERNRHQDQPATGPNLLALFGARIHAGTSVDLSHTGTAAAASSADLADAPVSGPVVPSPREGSISCRTWLQSATAQRRLFLCASGRYALEQLTREPGQSPQFMLWHLSSEHRQAEQQTPLDARTVVTVLSYVAPEVLDKPGTIYGA